MGISFSQPLYLLLLVSLVYFVYVWQKSPKAFPRWQQKVFLGSRLLLVVLLILALAGLQLNFKHKQKAVVYVADISASMAEKSQELTAWIKASLASLPPDVEAGVVSLGKKAMVEYPVAPHPDFRGLQAVVDPNYTDLAAGLRLARSLMPEERGKHVIMATDGKQNREDALELLKSLQRQGIRVDVLPVTTHTGPEVLVKSVEVPVRLQEGEFFDLKATLESTASTTGFLRIMVDNKVLREEQVNIAKGTTNLVWGMAAEKTGLHTYRVEVTAEKDTRKENNTGLSLSQVSGAPRVLLVEGRTGESKALREALTAVHIQADVVGAESMPKNLASLAQYSSLVLVNVPAMQIPDQAMTAIENFVRDLGRGLVMVGGENGYGPGGYYKTPIEKALPVNMEITGKAELPSVGLNLIIDKSGSMCHSQNGVTKMDMAKEAAIRATELLDPKDQVGVIVFDSDYKWVVKTQPLSNKKWVLDQIGAIQPSGGTNMFPSLEAAYKALKEAQVKVKHIILLSDGVSKEGGNYDELLNKMRSDNVTLSTVAVGSDSDTALLSYLAQEGRGRYYFTNQIDNIPKIFAKETMMVTRSYFVQEQFTPIVTAAGGMLPANRELPSLLGYVATTPKDTAEVVLTSHEGDPVLARWRYGLGRAVAWTSDGTGRWAGPWLAWSEFAQFWGKVISWTLPEDTGSELGVNLTRDGGVGRLNVDLPRERRKAHDIEAKIIAPDGSTSEIMVPAVGPGEYRAEFPLERQGTYMVQLVEKTGDSVTRQQTAGIIQPYSPEYLLEPDRGQFLEQLAAAGGGQLLDPGNPGAVAGLPAPEVRGTIPLWPKLLLLSVLLLPLDIALRRFNWNVRWVALLQARLVGAVRRNRFPVQHGQESLIQAIKEGKQRRERFYEARGRQMPAADARVDLSARTQAPGSVGTLGGTSDPERPGKLSEPEKRGWAAVPGLGRRAKENTADTSGKNSAETGGKTAAVPERQAGGASRGPEQSGSEGFTSRLLAAKKRASGREHPDEK